jgi:DMSO/TMAO reductase YedYZ molybdopterin-dependent catalytic subunit
MTRKSPKKQERGLCELYENDPERADSVVFGRVAENDRRGFLKGAGLATMGAIVGSSIPFSRNMPAGLIPQALAQDKKDFKIEGKEGMTVHNDRPINAETPAHLLDPDLTPNKHFFVRNNGLVPEKASDPDAWELTIDGEVNSPMKIKLGDLKRQFTNVTIQGQLECGGNGRMGFNPPARGNQWTVGAVGNAQWKGVRMADVLKKAGLKPSAVYTGHEGADPHLSRDPKKLSISRGVPMHKALDPETLIVWEMNGEALPLIHGGPLRVVAPGWPGSCSQKWLTRVWVRDKEHDGPGMTGVSYRVPAFPVAPGTKVANKDMAVINSMPVKSVITYPKSGTKVAADKPVMVRGHAWAGDLQVKEVHVSVDFGATWQKADLKAAPNAHAWQRWSAQIKLPMKGYYEIWARATDDRGVSQPVVIPGWNPRGYLNNSSHRISVTAA